MAKFYAIATILLCLFTLSSARSTPENDDVTTFDVASHKLRLPIETTTFTLRPINRRFPMRPNRNHHHHRQFNFDTNKGSDHVQIPYGNDMIVSSGENSDFEIPHGGDRRWIRLHHHHHHHNSDINGEDEDDKRIVFNRHDSSRFDREKMAWKKMRKHFRIQNEERKRGDFMKRVRDFIDNYF